MSLSNALHLPPRATPLTDRTVGDTATATNGLTRTAGWAQVALRLSIGFVFLWAFLDKAFGLGYSTPAERAWINGGSPTRGFLSHVEVGPFQDAFRAIAGAGWADWLFMLGLLAIGVAVILGVAMWPAAVAGSVMMLLMWAAEWPLAQFTSTGDATGSVNPFMDYHLIYALALILLAALGAGRTGGLGTWWARLTGHRTWLR